MHHTPPPTNPSSGAGGTSEGEIEPTRTKTGSKSKCKIIKFCPNCKRTNQTENILYGINCHDCGRYRCGLCITTSEENDIPPSEGTRSLQPALLQQLHQTNLSFIHRCRVCRPTETLVYQLNEQKLIKKELIKDFKIDMEALKKGYHVTSLDSDEGEHENLGEEEEDAPPSAEAFRELQKQVLQLQQQLAQQKRPLSPTPIQSSSRLSFGHLNEPPPRIQPISPETIIEENQTDVNQTRFPAPQQMTFRRGEEQRTNLTNTIGPQPVLPQETFLDPTNEELYRRRILDHPDVKEVPVFDGTPGKFRAFWQMYSIKIHNNRKFSLQDKIPALLGVTTGEVHERVSGTIGVRGTQKGYDWAIDYLIHSFGSTTHSKDDMLEAIENLPKMHRYLLNIGEINKVVMDACTFFEERGTNEELTNVYMKRAKQIAHPHWKDFIMNREASKGNHYNSFLDIDIYVLREYYFKQLECIQLREIERHNKIWGKGKQETSADRETSPSRTQSKNWKKNKSQRSSQSQSTNEGSSSSHKQQPAKSSKPADKKERKQYNKEDIKCLFCDERGSHFAKDCPKYKDMKTRKDLARSLCSTCLHPKTEHSPQDCRRKNYTCGYCKQKGHHIALCEAFMNSKGGGSQQMVTVESEPAPTSTEAETATGIEVACFGSEGKATSISPSIPGKLVNRLTGEEILIKGILLDTGANFSSISKEVAYGKLGLTPITSELKSISTYEAEATKVEAKELVQFDLYPGSSDFSMPITAWTSKAICPPHTVRPVDFNEATLKRLKKYNLLNMPPSESEGAQYHVIIGEDHYNKIMHAEGTKVENLPQAALVVHRTPFGDIIHGGALTLEEMANRKVTEKELKAYYNEIEDFESLRNKKDLGTEVDWDEALKRLYSLEVVGIEPPGGDQEKHATELAFEQTMTRKPDGRICVNLPLKNPDEKIDSNFSKAFQILKSTYKNLEKEGNGAIERYDDRFKKQIIKGQLVPVTEKEPTDRNVHYLSHFKITKSNSQHTKERTVINPAMKTKEGKSLNDMIDKGPNLMNSLAEIMLRFRMEEAAIVCDVQEAFLNIGVNEVHQDLLRILWLKDPLLPPTIDNIQVYKYTVLPFGVNACPFLLVKSIDMMLQEDGSEFAQKLRGQIYMDNIIGGAEDTAEECLDFYYESKKLFRSAKMNLREYNSNNTEFLSHIPKVDRGTEEFSNVLGATWNLEEDSIRVKMKESTTATTKRQILSCVMSGFDVLGLFSPVWLKGRLFYQELIKAGYTYDEPLPENLVQEWKELYSRMLELLKQDVGRRIVFDLYDEPVHLVAFVDASSKAYGCVIYAVQYVEEISSVWVGLVFAKSRVAPLSNDKLTLPRLEMMGAVLGTRALHFVEKTIEPMVGGGIGSLTVYCDSQIVLHQIHKEGNQGVWINNRVKELKQDPRVQFRYVRTKENPADHVTRGLFPDELKDSNYWEGPIWLKDNPWPDPPLNVGPADVESLDAIMLTTEEPVPEENKCAKPETLPFKLDPEDYNSFDELMQASAMHRLQSKTTPSDLHLSEVTAEDLSEERAEWFKAIQQNHYADIIEDLEKGVVNKRTKQLNLFLDPNGLIRCGSRLTHATIPLSSKFPVYLPHCPIVEMFLRQIHQDKLHASKRHILNDLRSEYGVHVQAASGMLHKVIKTCQICNEVDGKPFQPPPFGDLIKERLEMKPAFSNCGWDYAGPFEVKRGHDDYKKFWLSVFVCQSSRGVLIDPVDTLTAQSAINSLKRFMDRRGGPPEVIYCDNATNFVKTAKFMEALDQMADEGEECDEEGYLHLKNFLAKSGTKFRNIPEHSPHYGGFYERMMKTIKSTLYKGFKKINNEDDFRTLVAGIEHHINTRPLVQNNIYSTDPNAPWAITPMDFIAPGQNKGRPAVDLKLFTDKDFDPDENPLDTSLKKSHMKLEKQKEEFSRLYQAAYFSSLRQLYNNRFGKVKGEVKREPTVGEVVLIQSKSPRNRWPVAKIINVHPSQSDGLIRYASIQYEDTGNVSTRAIKDLIPLESQLDSPQKEQRNFDVINRQRHEKEFQEEEYCNPEVKEEDEEEEISTTQNPNGDFSHTSNVINASDHSHAPLKEAKTSSSQESIKMRNRNSHPHKMTLRSSPKSKSFVDMVSTDLVMAIFLFALFLIGIPEATARIETTSPIDHFEHQVPSNKVKRPEPPIKAPGYQICSSGPGGSVLELPQAPPKCEPPDPKKEGHKAKIQLYTPNNKWPSTTAAICYFETVSVTTYKNFVGSKSEVAPRGRELSPTSEKDCARAFSTLRYNSSALTQHPDDKNTYYTNKTLEAKFYWMKTHYEEVTNFVISFGTITSNDGEHILSSMINTDNCTLSQQKCVQQHATLVWNVTTMAEKFCPFTLKGTYKAEVRDKHILIPDLQVALHLTAEKGSTKHSCLPRNTLFSKEGPVVRLPHRLFPLFATDFRNKSWFQQKLIKANGTRNLTGLDRLIDHNPLHKTKEELNKITKPILSPEEYDPVNVKLNFLAESIMEEVGQRFQREHFLICQLNQLGFKLLLHHLRHDPSAGARILLDREDISAETWDDHIYIHQCRSVEIEQRYNDHKNPEDGRCYEFPPVKLKGLEGTWYIAPGSKDIVTHSPQASCSRIEAKTRASKAIKNTIHEYRLLPQLGVDGIPDIPTFTSPPLFKARVNFPAAALARFGSEILHHRAQITKIASFVSKGFTDDDAVERIIMGYYHGLSSLVSTAGGAIKVAGEGIADLAGGAINSLPRLLAAILIIAAVVLGGGLAVYCLIMNPPKCKRALKIRKMNRKPKSINQAQWFSDGEEEEMVQLRQCKDKAPATEAESAL